MHWSVIWQYRSALWDGLILTLELSGLSIAGSLIVGTVIGSLGAGAGFFLPRLAHAYVELLRNIPVVVKVFFFYFVVGLDSFPSGVIALTTHQSAYIADVIAAGFRSIAREQIEAARVLGHSYAQILRFILLPQVFRLINPPLTNQFIEVVKNSAIVMMVGVEELTFRTQQIESETFRGFEAATAVTLLYLVITLVVATAMSLLQRRARRHVVLP
jgi:polar amino acid transport system permease protein